ncbi:MAG: signal peptidase I [Patescibacteria group bacterium]
MNNWRQSLGEIVRFIVITVIVVVPIRAYVAQPFIVSGKSMVPTFADGEYLVIDELSYHFRPPTRGEVIVFRYPNDPKKFFIKRVIGLPGETVEVRNGVVWIEQGGQQTALTENYLATAEDNSPPTTLGSKEYFVMGDNRPMSLDSRSWGPVNSRLITGRVLLRLLPLSEIAFLPGQSQ